MEPEVRDLINSFLKICQEYDETHIQFTGLLVEKRELAKKIANLVDAENTIYLSANYNKVIKVPNKKLVESYPDLVEVFSVESILNNEGV